MTEESLKEKIYVETVSELFVKGFIDLSLETVTEESRDQFLRAAYEAARRAAEIFVEASARHELGETDA